jgi:hypothetical protein
MRGSAAAGFLGLRVRIPLGHGCLLCYALSGREVSASDWSLDQRILSGVVSLSVIVKPLEKKVGRGEDPKTGGSAAEKK